MRITLINPRENYDVVLPMGIAYIATVLHRDGHEIQVWDIGPREQEWMEKVKTFAPGLIGFSIVTPQYQRAKLLIKQLKGIFPDIKYCAGGPHPTALPEETLRDLQLDFVVRGEGEPIIKEACRNLENGNDLSGIKGISFWKDGRILSNDPAPAIADLDTIPFIKRELLPDNKWYLIPPGVIRGRFQEGIATIMSSRGCPYDCIFCASNKIFGKGVRRRSVENVIEECRYLKNDYKVNGLFFFDDTFTANHSWVKEFCERFKQEKFNLVWGCQVRADTVTKELLLIMKDAGCIQIDIGVESGNDKILQNLNKNETTDEIRKAFKIAKEAGIRAFATFILGSPGEGLKEIEETRKFALEIKPDMAMFCLLVPYPGSAIFELSRKNNWLTKDALNYSNDWSNKQSETGVLSIEIPPDILIKKRAGLENLFLWRNHKVILFGLLTNIKYLSCFILSILKNHALIKSALIKSIKNKKFRFLLEECYQCFSYEMKMRLMRKE